MINKGKGQSLKPKLEEEELFMGIMKEYNDSAIPPLSYFSPMQEQITIAEKGSSGSRKGERTEPKLRDRKRKDRMIENFSVLQSMVPDIRKTKSAKKLHRTQEKAVCDTLKYIQVLEEEVQRLEGLKKSQKQDAKIGKPLLSKKCISTQKSEKVTISGEATFLATKRPFRRGLVQDIVEVLEKHQAEVLEARVFVDDQRLLTFTATIMLGSGGASTVDKIKGEILVL